MLLAMPLTGAFSLTIVLIAFFLIEGIATILFSLDHKRELSGQWGWMLVSGIVDLVLAFIIFSGLPGTAAWALGLLVGINMLFGGSALIAMALHARKAPAYSALSIVAEAVAFTRGVLHVIGSRCARPLPARWPKRACCSLCPTSQTIL